MSRIGSTTALLLLVFAAVSAQASVPDHAGYESKDCKACHAIASPNKAPSHQGYDCTICHDVNNRTTPNLSYIPETIATPNSGTQAVLFTARIGANSFADGDATYDGICEVCHTTTSYHQNTAAGDHLHNVSTTCVDCHTHADGFATQGCTDCHNTVQGTGNYRRQVVENLGDGGGDFVLATHHVTNGTTTEVVTNSDCVACHDMAQHQTFSDGVSVLLKDPTGGASIVYDGTPASVEAWCVSCHDGVRTPFSDGATAPDQSTWNGSQHGTVSATCLDCHGNGHGSANLGIVANPIDTPSSGSAAVLFSARTGANSFADGDATFDGVCEVCHTATTYHLNAGGGAAHHPAEDCASCHVHNDGFQPTGASCFDCHNTVLGAGNTRRQIVENAGDGGGDFVLTSHHVTNGTTTEVITAADCEVCHDQANHQSYVDGVSVLLKDPTGGASIVYDGTAASLEPFCLACHDGTHSSPFSDTTAAPDMSAWNGTLHGPSGKTCADCHNNGHGTGNLKMVGDQILTPNSGTLPVVLTGFTGANSLADGDAIFNGACEVCHTSTAFHRNTAGAPPHNAGLDCRTCHAHNSGYAGVGTCFDCHNVAVGTGNNRRQIVENAGDGGGDFVLTSHHVTNGTTTEVVTESDCLACHDQTNHMTYGDGVSVLLVNAGGGASILYDGTSASADAFCLACHDGTQLSPFSDGNPAPDKSAWNGGIHGPAGKNCLNCHTNGHGSSNLALFGSQIATPNSGTLPVLLTGYTGTNSLADGDATFNGACEVCHTATTYHRNSASGDHTHNAATDCRTCHSHDAGYAGSGTCLDCHNAVQGAGGVRRQIVENAGDGGGDFVLTSHHVTNGTTNEVVNEADCEVCHDQANHQAYADGVSVLLKDPAGGASILYNGTDASLEPFCLACHDGTHSAPFSDGNPAPDKSAWDGGVHGPAGKTCTECHGNGHGSSNIDLIKTQIQTPNSGLKAVVLTGYTGAGSFADGDANYNGVCEACHTTTTYHRNDATGDHAHNVATDCRACHTHDTGYVASGTCLDCHNTTQASGTRRQVVENAGDGGGDFVRTSHHVTNGTTNEVVNENDCVVCHDQTNHQTYADGVSVYLNKPAGGAAIAYDGTDASLTPFCRDCHDGSVTGTPFSDGRTPTNNLGSWAASLHGVNTECSECHSNGHGGDSQNMLTGTYEVIDNTNYSAGDYALCWNCHNSSTIVTGWNSFEDLHDLHVIGEQAPCIICHNTHGGTDSGEPGMIGFEYGIANGMDIAYTNSRNASTAFEISGDTGFCYVNCHGKGHSPKDYVRTGKLAFQDMTTHVEGDGAFAGVRVFPSPSQGPVTVVLQRDLSGPDANKSLESLSMTAAIYDVAGRKLRTLNVESGASAEVLLRWDGRDKQGRRVTSGVYFCRVSTAKGARTVKLMVVR